MIYGKRANLGFTLLELVVVISVLAIISTVGLISFSNYNKSQELSSSVSNIASFLNNAKSNSLSQVKPCDEKYANSQEPRQTLKGYRVRVITGGSGTPSRLEMFAECTEGSGPAREFEERTLTLPTGITIGSVTYEAGKTSIFYPLFSKNVDGATLCIHGYDGVRKRIRVGDEGVVRIDDGC